MYTLNKKYTSLFFKDPSNYNILIERWSKLSKSDLHITSTDFLLYAVVRGKNYRKAFFPGRKMQHYSMPEGLWQPLIFIWKKDLIFNKLFDDLLVKDWQKIIRQILPNSSDDHYSLDPYLDLALDNLLLERLNNKI